MVFYRKQTIEDLEVDLTEKPKQTSSTDNVYLSEVEKLMNPSLKKLRIAMIWKMILKKNEIPNHIKRQ